MTARVLVVDDVLPNVKLLEAKLTSEYFDVVCCTSGEMALELVETAHPDIVLLDVMMPGMDGFEVCRRIKSNPRTSHLPVVMVTALDQQEDRVTGLEAGADDFLTKPVHDIALLARVRSLVRLKMLTDELRMREATGQMLGGNDMVAIDISSEVTDARILVVDDQRRSAERMADVLGELGTVEIVADGQTAVNLAQENETDLAIVSLALAATDGLRVCSQLRSFENSRHVPILIVVDENDSRDLVKGFELGVNDYLVRPIDRNELLARARTQIRRKRYGDRLRRNMHMNFQMAMTDAVTGLYNRHFMSSHLEALMSAAHKEKKPISLLMLDIDYFKQVNDEYGHSAGDEVLREFGKRIARNIRGVDLAARFGGEEFVVIMPDTDLDYARTVAERLRSEIEGHPFTVPGVATPISVTISAGVATLQAGAGSAQSLIDRADKALYEAKNNGRNQVVVAAQAA
ncbi:MAG: PleD family two-component system response regulator [Alphaproteobacteria bacterium]|nr:MAG: PleD family two-component system response regulator [Alphaproteobacteria bacterium]